MKYTVLTQDQQKQMLEQRVAGLEAEHYNHSINLQLLESTGDTSDEVQAQIQASKDAMQIIEDAHSEVTALLDEMPDDPPPNSPGKPAPNRAERRAKATKNK